LHIKEEGRVAEGFLRTESFRTNVSLRGGDVRKKGNPNKSLVGGALPPSAGFASGMTSPAEMTLLKYFQREHLQRGEYERF